MITVAPGDTLRVSLQSLNTSDVPTDADSTPTFAMWRNGTVDGAVTFTVSKPAATTGLYMAYCTVPTTYAEGDYLAVRATYDIAAAARAQIVERLRLTNRLNAIEGLAENIGAILAQMSSSMVNVQAEVNALRQIHNAGVSLSGAERTAVANSNWSHTDGRNLMVAIFGTGGIAGADTNNLTNHDFTYQGTTVRFGVNAAGNYRNASRLSG